jgi:hypothetical protein
MKITKVIRNIRGVTIEFTSDFASIHIGTLVAARNYYFKVEKVTTIENSCLFEAFENDLSVNNIPPKMNIRDFLDEQVKKVSDEDIPNRTHQQWC